MADLRTAKLHALQLSIESHLEQIERILGGDYKLTLLAKYHGKPPTKDADILLTRDSRENMLAVINRFLPSPETNLAKGPPPVINPQPKGGESYPESSSE